MRDIRIGTLQWAVGSFCSAIGALALVAPHQFAGPTFAFLQADIGSWGAVLFTAGAALVACAALSAPRFLVTVVHLFAGAVLLFLAGGFAATGSWSGTVVYSVLGTGTVVGGFLPRRPRGTHTGAVDLFAVLLALGICLNGLVLLGLPGSLVSPVFDPVRPNLSWFGLAFFSGGLGVLAVQIVRSFPPLAVWPAHLFLGGVLLTYMVMATLPDRIWTGIAFYGGFGLIVAILPWLGPRLARVDPASLRMRLAVALAIAAAGPLIAVVAVVTDRQQQVVAEQALRQRQTLAAALAQDVADYLGLHRAAVAALATQPGLGTAPRETHVAVANAFARAYPEALVFATFDVNGGPIASTDDQPHLPAAGFPLFEDARRTNGPSVDIPVSRLHRRPLFAFGVPIPAPDGTFGGLATIALASERLAEILQGAASASSGEAYLVDGRGRIIAHPNAELAAALADMSRAPPVAMLLQEGDTTGSLRYAAPEGEHLAGYSRVPALGWGVVVESPVEAALAGVQAGRDLAFAVLLLAIGVASIAGLVVASWLAEPLRALARAANQLAAGNVAAPLPRSRITEVAYLARAFGEMRDSLVARTAERRRAQHALRESEERLRFLAEASKELASSLDYETTLRGVAHLSVPTLADYCFIDVVEEDGRIRRVEVAYADPSKADLAMALVRFPPDPDAPAGIAEVLRTGEPELVPEITDTYLRSIAQNADHARLMLQLGYRSCMRAPLVTRGRTLGALSFVTAESGRVYGSGDLALAQELAGRAALSVDNARLYGEAQEAIRARDEFLSIASHELRTPVAGIKGYAQLLLRTLSRGHLDEVRLARSLQALDDAADRLTGLTYDLLDVSRIRLGQLPLRVTPIDLGTLVRDVTRRFEDQLDDRHALRVDVAGDPCVAVADAERLEQVLANLLENAAKYSPRGGEISVRLTTVGENAMLSVRDHGIGLPADASEAIFEPFGRAANAAKENVPGMGLGLYICRDIVQRHGGRIRAESDGEGQGVTVTIQLPLASTTASLELVNG